MPRPKRPVKPPRIACNECSKEVPASAARTAEGKDYLLYFCGLDCHDRWRSRRKKGGGHRPPSP
jgi:hypothetical protein